jgi:hypothetical protein
VGAQEASVLELMSAVHFILLMSFFFFFFGTGVQGLELVRQVLCHMAHTFCLSCVLLVGRGKESRSRAASSGQWEVLRRGSTTLSQGWSRWRGKDGVERVVK